MKPIKPESLNKLFKEMMALTAKMKGTTRQTQLKIEKKKPFKCS